MDRPHAFTLPQYVADRIMAKRGRMHVFEHFDPAETALLVIDMQNFYVSEVATARAIVPNINRLAAGLRSLGGTVAWVNMTAGQDGRSLWSVYHDWFFTEAKGRAHRDRLSAGDEGHKLYAALDAKATDLHTVKTRFSPFIAGASNLDSMLRARRIRNLLVAGTATNMCCETAARDAMMLDYRVIMVHDACAARYDEDHIAGLTSFYQSFGDVRSTYEVIEQVLTPRADRKETQA